MMSDGFTSNNPRDRATATKTEPPTHANTNSLTEIIKIIAALGLFW